MAALVPAAIKNGKLHYTMRIAFFTPQPLNYVISAKFNCEPPFPHKYPNHSEIR